MRMIEENANEKTSGDECRGRENTGTDHDVVVLVAHDGLRDDRVDAGHWPLVRVFLRAHPKLRAQA